MPKGILLTQLSREHPSIARNPLIANVFYLCGKIEKWGRGTLDMIQDCKRAGNPLPNFKEIGGSFSVTLPLKKTIRSIISTNELAQAFFAKLTTRQKEILNVLDSVNHTTQEIIAKINTSLTPRTIQQDLSILKSLGLAIAAGKGKGRTIVWRIIKS